MPKWLNLSAGNFGIKPMNRFDPPDGQQATAAAPQASEAMTLDTRQLFAQSKVIRILHLGQTYVLRLTKENKLILTK